MSTMGAMCWYASSTPVSVFTAVGNVKVKKSHTLEIANDWIALHRKLKRGFELAITEFNKKEKGNSKT